MCARSSRCPLYSAIACSISRSIPKTNGSTVSFKAGPPPIPFFPIALDLFSQRFAGLLSSTYRHSITDSCSTEMLKQKASGIVITLKSQLVSPRPSSIWCVERIIAGIQPHFTDKDAESLCSAALSLLSTPSSSPVSTISTMSRLVLLKLSAELLPRGVSPYSLSAYLSTVVSQRPFFAAELHQEFCVVSSRILAGVSHCLLPQRDVSSIENACGTLLNDVLSAEESTIALSMRWVAECLK